MWIAKRRPIPEAAYGINVKFFHRGIYLRDEREL